MFETVLSVVVVVGFFGLGLFIKNYLPNYMTQKGRNLATKEDIKEITEKTEQVRVAFQKEFANFSEELKFKNEFNYKQYSQLYSKLYAIIVQSEYFRYFATKHHNENFTFEEVPFFEISGERKEVKADLFSGAIISQKTEQVVDSVTEYNKLQIANFVITNGDVASQKLLKLAVAYRYAHRHYSGSKNAPDNENLKKAFDDEEFEIIKQIVQTIIIDYNALRKSIKLDYNESELETGFFNTKDFHSNV